MKAALKTKVRLKPTATASLFYTASSALSRGVTLLYTPFFTRLLSPHQYGIYALYNGWLGILTAALTLEINGGIIYKAISESPGDREDIISGAVGLESLLSLSFFFIYILFQKRINAITSLSTALTLAMLLQIFLSSLINIYFSKKKYCCEYKSYALINTVMGALIPTLALILILYTPLISSPRITAHLLVTLIFAIPMLFDIIRRSPKLFSPTVWKRLIFMALPLFPHYLAFSGINQAEKIIISRIVGSEGLGRYSVAHSAGLIISLLTVGLSSAINPWIIKKLSRGELGVVKGAVSLSVRVLSILTPLILSLMPEAFKIIAGKEFYSALDSVYPIAISVVFVYLCGILCSILIYFKRFARCSINTVISLAALIPTAILLTKSMGYLGGSVATLLAYMLLTLFNLSAAKGELKESVIDTKHALASLITLFSFTLLMALLKHSLTARLILAVALLLLLLREWREVKVCFLKSRA